MHQIVSVEGQPGLLSGLFMETFRLLAPEIESVYLSIADNPQKIKTDLLAISQSVKALNIDEEASIVVKQKINSLLLTKCGYAEEVQTVEQS